MLKKGNVFLTPIERHNLVTFHQWLKELENFFLFSEFFITQPSLDELEYWYNSLLNNFRNKVFIINLTDSRAPIGIVELSRIDWKNRNAAIGIIIGNKQHRQKGFATTAIKIIMDLAFNHWNLHKLYALVVENNTPSVKLFEKLKFTKEAILRETIFFESKYYNQIVFSLLKNEYEQNIDFYNS